MAAEQEKDNNKNNASEDPKKKEKEDKKKEEGGLYMANLSYTDYIDYYHRVHAVFRSNMARGLHPLGKDGAKVKEFPGLMKMPPPNQPYMNPAAMGRGGPWMPGAYPPNMMHGGPPPQGAWGAYPPNMPPGGGWHGPPPPHGGGWGRGGGRY